MARKLPGMIVIVVLAFGAVTADAEASLCSDPEGDWERRSPSELGLDPAGLQDAFDWANAHDSLSVAVYRHGCLAGESRLDEVFRDEPLDGWSMTKSVTSMVVGRAVTLGLFDLDEPIGTHVPEADAAHAALAPRQLLTMTSGLRTNYPRDFALPLPDRVCDALALPFEYEPGTTWQYAQTTLDLLIHALERALGRDVQEFAQAELFGPIGIPAGSWTWDRDPHDHTNAWAHLRMPNGHWARLGQLMLRGGLWNGERLLSSAYVQEALTGIPDNPAYGLLFWRNGGEWWRVPDVEGRDDGVGPLIPAGPSDLFLMAGIGEQRTWVIPSRDLVIVRLGDRGSHDTDTRVSVWSGRAGEIDHEILRRVLRSVTDAPYEDPGPYRSAGTILPPPDQGFVGDVREIEFLIDGMTTPACH